MSNALLHILLCCHHKITLVVKGTHDEWIPPEPSSVKHHRTLQTSPHFIQYFFHCLAIERSPDTFCFCQNCTIIRPYIVTLSDWIQRNFSSDKATEPEAWSHRPTTKWQLSSSGDVPAAIMPKPELQVDI